MLATSIHTNPKDTHRINIEVPLSLILLFGKDVSIGSCNFELGRSLFNLRQPVAIAIGR